MPRGEDLRLGHRQPQGPSEGWHRLQSPALACGGQWDLGLGTSPSSLRFFITVGGLGSCREVCPTPWFWCCLAVQSRQVSSPLLGPSFLIWVREPLISTLCAPLAYLSHSVYFLIIYYISLCRVMGPIRQAIRWGACTEESVKSRTILAHRKYALEGAPRENQPTKKESSQAGESHPSS